MLLYLPLLNFHQHPLLVSLNMGQIYTSQNFFVIFPNVGLMHDQFVFSFLKHHYFKNNLLYNYNDYNSITYYNFITIYSNK